MCIPPAQSHASCPVATHSPTQEIAPAYCPSHLVHSLSLTACVKPPSPPANIHKHTWWTAHNSAAPTRISQRTSSSV